MESLLQQASECDYVRFTCTDMHGIARGKCIPKQHVSKAMKEGISLSAGTLFVGARSESSIIKMLIQKRPSISAVPMPDTFHTLPYAGAGKYTVGEVLCETLWSDGSPQEACPRYVARKQIERLVEEFGYSTYCGWEVEFVLVHTDTKKPVFASCDFLSNILFSEHEEFYLDLHKNLEETGVRIEAFHVEHAPGQIEYATRPSKNLCGVDMAFNCKQAIKVISAQNGFQAVFMSKNSLEDTTANAMQFNFSILDGNNCNVFADPDHKDKLSKFALHFLAGLLSHARALSAFCCPTANCYRRLHQSVRPGSINWGVDSRLAYIRVRFGAEGPYFENRSPGAPANPYLVMASTLAAGLDGVSKELECPPEMEGPETARKLPYSLEEALEALVEDTVIVQSLGEQFVDWFVTTKRGIELEQLKTCINETETFQLEQKMYFKMF